MKYFILILFLSTSVIAADMDRLVDSEVKRIKKSTGPETVTCRISPDEFSALTLADIDLMLGDCADHKKDVFELAYCEGKHKCTHLVCPRRQRYQATQVHRMVAMTPWNLVWRCVKPRYVPQTDDV